MTILLHALDNLTQIAAITTLARAEIVERDLGVGTWRIEIPIDTGEAIARKMTSATWPGLEVYDSDTGKRYGGYLTSLAESIDRDGRHTITLQGNDFMGDLQARLEWPDYTTLSHWWQQWYGGTIPITSDAMTMIATQAGSGAAPQRQIAGLVLGVDPVGGPAKARRLKGLPLLEVLHLLFYGEDYTARLQLVRDDVRGTPSLRFDTPARPVSPTPITSWAGRVREMTVTDTADSATFVIAMGAEIVPNTLPDRYVALSAINNTNWRERHIETFINRPTTDTQAHLLDDADQHLAQSKRRRSVRVSSLEVDGYGRVIDIGWYVDVHLSEAFQSTVERLPVVASTLRYDHDNGWRRTVDLGGENMDNYNAVIDPLTRLARRARQIETELTV